ncbi:hypothetical protein DXA92_07855 [Agathobaculum butyriciproducens]|nr:hypothetical protein DXA94_02750 [Agathobaculum butyriciproducens]RGC60851.1 hypothetical protein DXA92_07855 [Agathobaculum butyriciproducens]
MDLGKEISFRFEQALEQQMDELDFFIYLLGEGITLSDIKTFCPENYEYSKMFMAEHGLVSM